MLTHGVAAARVSALLLLLSAPLSARALTLLDEPLRAPDVAPAPLALDREIGVALATIQKDDERKGEATGGEAQPGGMDFDLLGEAKPPPEAPSSKAMKRRRQFLNWHQGVGFGLVGLQLATTAVGQLNYNDRFGDANTAKYRDTHAALAYTTVGVFAINGALALLAPRPVKTPRKMDRVMVHRIALFTAAAAMVGEAGLGIYTRTREGYLDKEDYGKAHLALGYVTLAALATGVGALVY